MKQPLIAEAWKEMCFALSVLLKELEDEEGFIISKHAKEKGVGPSVQGVEIAIAWMRKDIVEKLRDVWIDVHKQIKRPPYIGSFSKTSQEWVNNDGRVLLYKLANSWNSLNIDMVNRMNDVYPPISYVSRFSSADMLVPVTNDRLPSADKIDMVYELNTIWKDFGEQLDNIKGMQDTEKQKLQLLVLASHTKLVRDYTDIWTIYRMRIVRGARGQATRLERAQGSTDYIATQLYATATAQHLDLSVPEQALITVFFRNEAFTLPSRTAPLPYIVIPRWALSSIWIANAIAHEVGHNILWNVKGLFDELLVTLMFKIAAENFSVDRQRVWGGWLEEIFADLFGLLQIGPTIIRSQQRLLIHLPTLLLQKPSLDKMGQVLGDLRVASDTAHPVEYLRVWLSIEALKMLVAYEDAPKAALDQEREQLAQKEIQALEERWRTFMQETGATKPQGNLGLIADGPALKTPRVSARSMVAQAKIVVRIILFTPLNALSDNAGQLRSLVDVFHHKTDYIQTQHITEALLTSASLEHFNGVDLQTLLAATVYAFEQAEQDHLGELSDRVIAVIAEKITGELPQPQA